VKSRKSSSTTKWPGPISARSEPTAVVAKTAPTPSSFRAAMLARWLISDENQLAPAAQVAPRDVGRAVVGRDGLRRPGDERLAEARAADQPDAPH